MSPPLKLSVAVESLPLAQPFVISGYVFEASNVVVVTLDDGTHQGRGEASGVYYLGDDVASMTAAIGEARAAIETGIDRDQLRAVMPPGGGRNAVDAALWELEARRTGVPVSTLAGVGEPRPLVTTFTLGAGAPEKMAAEAVALDYARHIKIKLTGDLPLDIERVKAIRAARPQSWLGVDGNQGFKIGELDTLVAAMLEQDVSLIEQPLARGREADLDGYRSPIPLAADESVITLDELKNAQGRFDVVNIKLDKCGGLTEALRIAEAARGMGLEVMVGNMVGTSLAMAPAFVLGQLCDIVDLDGPIFLKADRRPGVVYRDGTVWCGEEVWGRG